MFISALFMLIFNFNLFVPSAIYGFLFIFALNIKNVRVVVKDAFCKHTRVSLFLFNLILLISVFGWIFSGDFTFFEIIFTNLLFLFSAIMCFSYIKNNNFIHNYLIFFKIFYFQIFFMLIMFIFPNINEFVNSIIRSESQLDLLSSYGGVRGLALSGNLAFGLAVTLSLLYLFLVYFSVKLNLYLKFNIFLFPLVSLFLLSSGRVNYITILVCSILFVFNRNSRNYFFITIFSILVFIYLLIKMDLFVFSTEQFTLFFNFIFQIFINYFTSGDLSSSSLDSLNESLFLPGEDLLFFGDFIYTVVDGSNYMHQDMGYIRFALYFGYIISLLVYLFGFLYYLYLSKCKFSLFHLIFYIFLFVFHYKGDILFITSSFFFISTLIFLLLGNYEKDCISR